MEWVERTDRTVESAKDFLLDQLGVDESEAEFEVLEEPKPGLFGRVRGQARVRARVAPKAPRAKDDRRRRKARSDRPANGQGNKQRSEAKPKAEAKPAVEKKSDSSGGEGSGRPPVQSQRAERQDRPAADPNAFVEPVIEFLNGLASSFGVTATASVEISEEGELLASLNGENLGALIGPSGAVIDATQELTRTFLQKVAQGGSTPRLKLDIGNYKADRKDALAQFARTTAEQVVTTGKSHSFEPMGSMDRKTVHDAASEIEGIETRSEGDDPARRVVIVPA